MSIHVALFLLSSALSIEFPEENGVLVLHDKNFQEALAQHDPILIDFYAQWCAHCQALAPQFASAAALVQSSGFSVAFAKIDGEANSKATSQSSVEGFPTIRLFQGTKFQDYRGRHIDSNLAEWVLKKVGPAATELAGEQALEETKNDHPVAVVFYGEEHSEEAAVFREVVRELEGMYYYTVQGAGPRVVVYKHFDDKETEYKGEFSEVPLSKFIMKNQLRWVEPFEEHTRHYLFKNKNSAVFVFRPDSEHQQYSEIITQVVHSINGSVLVTYLDLNEGKNNRLADYLGVDAAEMPFAFIYEPDGETHTLKAPLSAVKIAQFVKQWQRGELKTYVKSSPLPEEPTEEGVKILVGRNFKQNVLRRDRDVLVWYYAPWCNHCKKLSPEYAEVAQVFENERALLIAKMDATANEVEGFEATTYPTITFYPAYRKEGIVFTGDLTVEGIKNFVLEKTSFYLDMMHSDEAN